MEKTKNKAVEIKFGGDLQGIDVNLLIDTLVSYSTIIQETTSYLSPSTKANIEIKAPKRGSFILSLALTTQNTINLRTKENIALASSIIAVVGRAISI